MRLLGGTEETTENRSKEPIFLPRVEPVTSEYIAGC
jgi:hypothetical protein